MPGTVFLNFFFPTRCGVVWCGCAGQVIKWGGISMVDAERRLLAQALLDPLNQRFVLVSDSCVPLFNFSFVYTYLLGTPVSFLRGSNYRGSRGRGAGTGGSCPWCRWGSGGRATSGLR